MTAIDIQGHKFGKLTVLSRAPKPDSYKPCRKAFWKCICDCGKETIVLSEALRKGRVKSCGCWKSEQLSKRGLTEPGLVGLRRIFRIYGKKAEQRNLVFNLSIEQFKELTQQNCFYCKKPPKNESSVQGTRGYTQERIEFGKYIYNGIDRVDNSHGYTIDNCVPCCKICNRMKSDMNLKNFFTHIHHIWTNYVNH